MFDIRLGERYLVDTEGTSDGTQLKYFHDGYWYKEDSEENEGIVEYLVSKTLTFSNLKKDEYVAYEQGKVNGRKGCRSKTFLGQDETFITLERMHANVAGQSLFEVMKKQPTMEERIAYTIGFFKDVTGLDLTDYFSKVFTLDYLVLNEDRHFHNLGIVMDGDGNYRPAPIFDNGKSLLNGNYSNNVDLPIAENVKRVSARPFSGSHKAMYEYFGKGFTLDVKQALAWLIGEEDTFYKRVLTYQLKQLK